MRRRVAAPTFLRNARIRRLRHHAGVGTWRSTGIEAPHQGLAQGVILIYELVCVCAREAGINRRRLLETVAVGVIAAASSGVAMAREVSPGATFVLVHGAWHGGWCWGRVRPLLEASGARVTTPTLTGLGERRHLIRREINLKTHVADIVQHIENEQLTNVVLVGHSYGGFPATLAATQLPGRVSQLVLLDAFFPHEGETILLHAGPDIANDYNAKAAASLDWNIPVLPASVFGLVGEDAAWVDSRLTPHPIATYTQAAAYGGGGLPANRSFVLCKQSSVGAVLATSLDHVRADPDFNLVEIEAGHDVMVDNPQLLADTLLALL